MCYVNNNLSNSLQYVHTAKNPFDFNDVNTPAGFHRINESDSFKNPPLEIQNNANINYGNIFVCKSNENSDTLSMTFYPYDQNTIFIKTANFASWEGKGWTQLVSKSDLSPIGTVFWSGLEEIQCVKDTLVSGQMTINLPAGTYVIFGHAVLDAGTSTGVLQINNAKAVEAYQTYYSSVYRRHVTVSCFFNFTEQVTLSVGLFDSANTKATTCEVCAVRIK